MKRRYLALVVLLQACDAPAVQQGPPRSDRTGVYVPSDEATILRTSVSGLSVPTQVMVTDTGTWHKLWIQTWSGAMSPPLPNLDFTLGSIVVFGTGSRGFAADSVVIDSLVQHAAGVEVYATLSRANPVCPPSGPLSAPVHMVAIFDHPPVLNWRLATMTRGCS